MPRKIHSTSRLMFAAVIAAILGMTISGLIWLNQAMIVRYQAIGLVTDDNGSPLKGVKAILLLSPPPTTDLELDELFQRQAKSDGSPDSGGKIRKPSGPIIGMSGPKGTYVARATGRLGAAHAIRLGLDSSKKPPFDLAWLVLRKSGLPDVTMTVPIMGWKTAPKDWGKFANRLPVAKMRQD